MKTYDLIVIGTGGVSIVADAAVRAGKRVAVIEKGKFGGTCLTRGCIPTKVLVTAADSIVEIKEMQGIGIEVNDATMNWDVVGARTWEVIDRHNGVREYYEAQELVDVYPGLATFKDNHSIVVTYADGTTSDVLTATDIVIATGGKTLNLPLQGLEEVGYISSESFFGDKFPKKPYESIIVLGGGAIATEFSHIFNKAGSKVTLIQRSAHLLKKEDTDVADALMRSLKKQGVDVRTNTKLLRAYKEGDLKVVVYEDAKTGEMMQVKAEEILLATGIQPETAGLGLENTDIELLPGGWIKTNEFLETSVDHVYALGDVNGEAALRHKANYEADILGHNLYVAKSDEELRWARYDLVPYVTFTYPQVAHVGLTEQEANALGYEVGTGVNYYANTAKGFALGLKLEEKEDAFVKIVVDKKTNKLLGAHAVGPQASALIQPFINLMNSGETVLTPVHEEIASERTKAVRAKGLVRTLDPHSVISIGETMTPHPAIQEVIMWTQDYYEKRW